MNDPLKEVWKQICNLLITKFEMSQTTIDTWFSDIVPVALEEKNFVISTPSDWKKGIIETRYKEQLQSALKELFSSNLDIVVLNSEDVKKYELNNSEDFLPGTERYTFDTFVVGSQNRFAHAAAQSVAEKPGEIYNPLFIHGESGLGKTHLLYAIAHQIHKKHPEYSIVYIKGDTFTNELISAIREGRNQEFREKYRFADVFLMDDVQFIAGKESTQEEFFHTFNALYEAKRQIVLTSDRPPREMARLEERLKTRFESGLIADIKPPDYETRMAILKNKSLRMGISLPDSAIQYIAENVTSNVRQLEGTITKLGAYKQLLGEDTDDITLIKGVQDMIRNSKDVIPTPELIMEEVCKFYNFDHDTLISDARTPKNLVQARQIAMYEIRKLTKISQKQIGELFGGKDHTTVIYSLETVEKKLKSSNEISEIIKDIESNIQSHFN